MHKSCIGFIWQKILQNMKLIIPNGIVGLCKISQSLLSMLYSISKEINDASSTSNNWSCSFYLVNISNVF